MIEDTFVIDAVIHGYNLDPSNFQNTKAAAKFAAIAYPQLHLAVSPKDDPRYVLSEKQFMQTPGPEFLASAIFEESQTDLGVYHTVPLYGFFKDGGSPMSIGQAIGKIAPGRMLYYGAVHPFDLVRAKEEIDRQLEEEGIIGLKFYPNDLWQGKLTSFRMDDEKVAFPIFEHARKRGLRSIAIHKAVVLGPQTLEDFRLGDIEGAALAFRDLNFEIVHGGWAFLEDTVMLAQCFRNIYVNLEGGSAFLNFAPLRFAHLVGSLLQAGAENQILWATGVMATHPRPLLEKFWQFEMPQDLQQGYGYPALTREIKQKILAGNFARLHKLDLAELAAAIPNDARRQRQQQGELAEPWSKADSEEKARPC